MGGRSLTPEENERVIEAVRELLRGSWSQTALADDPTYVLPEKAGIALANAVDPPVSVEWLRRGIGSMELDAVPTVSATTSSVPGLHRPREALIAQLAHSVPLLMAAGDVEGARIASQALSALLSEHAPGRVLEQHEEAPEGESHLRKKFVVPTTKTGS